MFRLKGYNSDNSYMLSCSRNAQVTFEEKSQLKYSVFKIIKININSIDLLTITDRTLDVVFFKIYGFFVHNNLEAEAQRGYA